MHQRRRVWLRRSERASPRAGGEETESEGAARRDDDVGAPRGCPGAPCARPLWGRRGRTKAAAAPGWRVVGSCWAPGLVGSGAMGSLPPAVLRSCAFGAAPLLRAASVPLPVSGSVSARRERDTGRRTGFLTFRPFSAPLSCRGDRRKSPWRLLNPNGSGFTWRSSQGRFPPAEWSLRPGFPQERPPIPSEPSGGLVWVGGSAFPARAAAFVFLQGDFPLVALNSRVERVLDDLGCGTEKARRTERRPPAGLYPPNAETQARVSRPAGEAGAAWASEDGERLVRTLRDGRGRRSPPALGL